MIKPTPLITTLHRHPEWILYYQTIQTLHVHSPDGSTFLHEMASWPPSRKCDIVSKIWFDVYSLRYNSAKFHPDLIWNDRALDFFWRRSVAPTRRTTTRWVAIWNLKNPKIYQNWKKNMNGNGMAYTMHMDAAVGFLWNHHFPLLPDIRQRLQWSIFSRRRHLTAPEMNMSITTRRRQQVRSKTRRVDWRRTEMAGGYTGRVYVNTCR